MNANVMTKSGNPNPDRLAIAKNALRDAMKPKPRFFIERATIKDGKAEIFFIDEAILDSGNIGNEDWRSAVISRDRLEYFISQTCKESGVVSDLTVDQYLDYNLYDVAKAYLDAGKELEVC